MFEKILKLQKYSTCKMEKGLKQAFNKKTVANAVSLYILKLQN